MLEHKYLVIIASK